MGEIIASPHQPMFALICKESWGAAGISSLDAYEIYRDHIDGFSEEEQPQQYLSMAVTSGGYKRQSDLTIPEIISKNAHYGALVKQNILGQNPDLHPSNLILPSEIGKVEGWNEADYLMFWFHVISSAHNEAMRAEDSVRNSGITELPSFLNYHLPRDERKPAYQQLADEYFSSLMNAPESHYNPSQSIGQIALILDPDMTLGGFAEQELASRLFIKTGPIELDRSQTTPELIAEVSTLRALGAATVELA